MEDVKSKIKYQISKLQKAQSGKGTKAQRRIKTLCLSASVPAAFSLILHF